MKTNLKVRLINNDGNAFAILGKVIKTMKQAKINPEIIKEYQMEATEGDYDNLLRVTMDYVEIVWLYKLNLRVKTWAGYWEISALISGKWYIYYITSEFALEKIEKLIKRKYYGKAINQLKKFNIKKGEWKWK